MRNLIFNFKKNKINFSKVFFTFKNFYCRFFLMCCCFFLFKYYFNYKFNKNCYFYFKNFFFLNIFLNYKIAI